MSRLLVCISLAAFAIASVKAQIESSNEDMKPRLIPLITFGEYAKKSNSYFDLIAVNDPVMGGESQSTLTLVDGKKAPHTHWVGEVVDVPFLSAPGFCSMRTKDRKNTRLNDITGASEIRLIVKSTTPEYQGFKLSFASKYTVSKHHIPATFQTNFTIPTKNANTIVDYDDDAEWQWISIPISTFSNDWSPYTGNQITPCSEETPEVCPKPRDLASLNEIAISAEGVLGEFNLDVWGIFAALVPPSSTSSPDELKTH